MSKTIKVILLCFSISILIPLSIFLSIVIRAYTAEGVIAMDGASVEYIEVDDIDYYLVEEKSINKNYFDEDTYHRLTCTIVFDFDSIEKAKIFDYNPLLKYAKIAINSDNVIYCDLIDSESEILGYGFYAPYEFKLPEISADNISKLEIFVYDGTDERSSIPLLTFSSDDEIDYFLSHYEEYISNYTSEETGALVCYVYYNNYAFEEQLHEDDLNLLLG